MGFIFFYEYDCTLVIIADSFNELLVTSNHDLMLIEMWLKSNRLLLNININLII